MRLENRWVLQHSWRSKVPRAWSCPYAALPWPADESKALWNLSHIRKNKKSHHLISFDTTNHDHQNPQIIIYLVTMPLKERSTALNWCVTHSFECFPRISSWNCHIQQVRSPAGFQLRWQSPRMSARIGSKSLNRWTGSNCFKPLVLVCLLQSFCCKADSDFTLHFDTLSHCFLWIFGKDSSFTLKEKLHAHIQSSTHVASMVREARCYDAATYAKPAVSLVLWCFTSWNI